MKWSSTVLRQLFLDYFVKNGHTMVPSSRLVPDQDPSLLFTNAGMVQFKDVFLGIESRPYMRAVSSQRCLRAGGKHNDLDEVGYTARHHTFFEMLGNFSFGDYFKRDAIRLAWHFITQVLNIPSEKLWVTVYHEDDESAAIWLEEMHIDPTRFSRCGEADNFWRMGDTGPCGPCTEIFYDHGSHIPGGPPGSPEADGDRYIEIWNLVFMQYNCNPAGELTLLPKPSVDTGMGLERLAAVMQGVHNNYDTDLFQPIIAAAAKLAGIHDLTHRSLRVMADHIRASAFLILDGVQPGNEGRHYVLRRIIRRAVRHGYLLGIESPFFSQLLQPLNTIMGEVYPELVRETAYIAGVIDQEEQQFAKTLSQGMRLVNQVLTELSSNQIPGETVFKLYDTYGFPTDLTADIARERGLTIDWQGFEASMAEQRQRAQQSTQFKADYETRLFLTEESEFVGYTHTTSEATCIGLYQGDHAIHALNMGDKGFIVLDKTPFYPESGGQVGDTGWFKTDTAIFKVVDTQRKQDAILHHGIVEQGILMAGDRVRTLIDSDRRSQIVLNHSATHLLHAALRDLLGEQVVQKGSLVAPDRLRFDFSYSKPLSSAQLQAIEGWVNQQIRANHTIQAEVVPYDMAIKQGAMALFGEKYGADVRMLTMGHVSTELCGGTHVQATGQIGFFKIISETGIAAGIRRLEALTGDAALTWVQSQANCLQDLSVLLKTKPSGLIEKTQQLQTQLDGLRKTVEQLQETLVFDKLSILQAKAEKIGDMTVLAVELPTVDPKLLCKAVQRSIHQLGKAVVVLATVEENRVSLVAGVAKELTNAFKANELANYVGMQIGGKGGGKQDLAQAGGNQPEQLPAALQSVVAWVSQSIM